MKKVKLGFREGKGKWAKEAFMELGTELSLKIYQECSLSGRKTPGRKNSPGKGEKVGRHGHLQSTVRLRGRWAVSSLGHVLPVLKAQC